MKGGFIGVDVFFVISGFLISTNIIQDLNNNSFSFSGFYSRRIKRIFPALILVLASSFVFGWFALLTDEFEQLGKHISGGAIFLSNFLLWQEAGYFDRSADVKPLLHLWSLGVEEQFYIIWPFLFWAAYKVRINLLSVSVIVASISLFLNMVESNHNLVADFYSPQTRFWELGSGSILAWIVIFKNQSLSAGGDGKFNKIYASSNVRSAASILGLVLLSYGFYEISVVSIFPGKWAIIPVLGAILIIYAGPEAWGNRVVLSNRILIWFGLISFPLYLWHWPLLSFAQIVEYKSPSSPVRLNALIISIVLAWLTYEIIEKNIRHRKSDLVVKILLTLMIFIGGLGFAAYVENGLPNRSAVKNIDLTQDVSNQLVGPLWGYSQNDACLTEYEYKDATKYGWWFCIKNSPTPPTMILLGNSYANQLYPGFSKNKNLSSHSILSIGTCDFGSDGSDVVDINSPCYKGRTEEQITYINKILTNARTMKFAVIDGLSDSPSVEYIERVRRRIDFIEKLGIKVIIFTPHLRPGFNPKLCFKTPFRSVAKDCSFSPAERANLFEKFQPLMKSILKSNPKTRFFEQNQIFCDDEKGVCSWLKSGMPLHRDEAHTSEFESILLQDYFTEWGKTNIPEMFSLR